MPRLLRVLMKTAGVLFVLVAGAGALLVGPDDTITTPSRHMFTDGTAIVTGPELLTTVGPTYHVIATGPSGRRLFAGVARTADARSYLGPAQRDVVSRFDVRHLRAVTHTEGAGPSDVTAPPGLDLWVAQDSGAGTVDAAWPSTDGDWSAVIMNADAIDGVQADVRLGVEINHLFLLMIGLVVIGLLLVAGAAGRLDARRRWRRLRSRWWGNKPAEAHPETHADDDALSGAATSTRRGIRKQPSPPETRIGARH